MLAPNRILSTRKHSYRRNVERHAGPSIGHGCDDTARLEVVLGLGGRESEFRDQEGENDLYVYGPDAVSKQCLEIVSVNDAYSFRVVQT